MKATMIIGRCIGLPFFILIALYGSLVLFLRYIKNYILYGGESVVYTNKNQPVTIKEVYDKLVENQKLYQQHLDEENNDSQPNITFEEFKKITNQL